MLYDTAFQSVLHCHIFMLFADTEKHFICMNLSEWNFSELTSCWHFIVYTMILFSYSYF